MRITCPNCDAQYEVPDDVIPPEGRDVQCSNCGTTWFQPAKGIADDVTEQASVTAVEDTPPEPVDAPAPDEEVKDTPVDAPIRKEMDPTVADILRQEGEREARARASEDTGSGLETQPDLGLTTDTGEDEGQRRAREARERMAKMRGEEAVEAEPDEVEELPTAEAVATAAAAGSRRELLPDIEEINSTLRSTGDRDVAGDDPDPEAPGRVRKRRGYRRGFLLALLIFVIALLVYVFAPDIAAQVPQADPWLSGYVTWVDGLREQLNAWMQSASQWLDDQAAASSR